MKSLLIYYSHTGNVELIAKEIAKKGVDLRLVIPKKKLPNSFFWSIFSGGFLATVNHKSKLVNFNNDVSSYDHVIIASPVWNGRFSCPINRVLKEIDLSNKKVSFVFSSGSGEAQKAVKKINKLYKDAQIIVLKEPKKHLEEIEKLEQLDLLN